MSDVHAAALLLLSSQVEAPLPILTSNRNNVIREPPPDLSGSDCQPHQALGDQLERPQDPLCVWRVSFGIFRPDPKAIIRINES